jgi:peptidoglycan/xylan/chitin deacetylase (PgdA/CDA1 family)
MPRRLTALVLTGVLAAAACSTTDASAPAPEQSPLPTTTATAAPSAGAAAGDEPGAAACTVPDELTGKEVTRLPLKRKKVALTFDGGGGAQGAPSILDTLDAKDVRATFFLTGDFARTFPEIARRIADEHLVGNHTNTHQDLTELTDEEIVAEVKAAQRAIRRKTGEDPRRFFRFPFGARTAHTIEVVNDLCYVPFRWTVDTLGWKGTTGGQSVATVVARVMDGAQPGEVVLMHLGAHPKDGSTLDADALPRVIKKLRAAGYSFVRLSRILSPEP